MVHNIVYRQALGEERNALISIKEALWVAFIVYRTYYFDVRFVFIWIAALLLEHYIIIIIL